MNSCFGTPKSPLADIGYFNGSMVTNDIHRKKYRYVVTSSGYNDCVMRKAVAAVQPKAYSVLGPLAGGDNCQSYAERLRSKYYELENDSNVRCECFWEKRNAFSTIIR